MESVWKTLEGMLETALGVEEMRTVSRTRRYSVVMLEAWNAVLFYYSSELVEGKKALRTYG